MNSEQIEFNLQKLIKLFDKDTFIYDLLLSYGLAKASITRLRKGNLNLSKVAGEVSWKKKLFFKEEFKEDLHLTITKLQGELKHNQRFVIVTDYKTLLAIDTGTDDKLDIALKDLPKYYDFFLPWAGMEKARHQNENPADVKAAEKMAKLFDEIKKDNPDDSPGFKHGLNVFLSRLLFCFFAEDTHIFEENQFTNSIDSHTQKDGSDLNTYLDKFFAVLNTPENKRRTLSGVEVSEYLNAFPYVNGGLFKETHQAPVFTRRSRQAIIDSGELDWSAINPDIFGSMFQAVISVDQRGSLGQHYTSVPNIMKVIEPLFLNDLYEQFDASTSSATNDKTKNKKLNALLNRIHNLKIFDPACGSGNFLIIAYKELRILEMKIFKEMGGLPLSGISLTQFYGIEIDDFAHEIAKLALWLAEHQMNVEFFKEFGRTNPTLPLKEAGQIVQGNAARLDWEEVCPKGKTDAERSRSEIYIMGNPPYLGFKRWDKIQKEDMNRVFNDFGAVKRLDYIGCWFRKGADFIIHSNSKVAFVTTNSITQGEQVSLLWPYIFKNGLEIGFAHTSFKWKNNAKSNAGVTVAIIGLRNVTPNPKFLITANLKRLVTNISPYLTNCSNSYVEQRKISISKFPEMALGSSGIDGGHLILSAEDRAIFLVNNIKSEKYIKKFIGGQDLLKSFERYCLWIDDDEIDEAILIKEIKNRIELCKKYRLNGGRDAKKAASVPHRFFYRKYKDGESIVMPFTSSANRDYLPIAFEKTGTISSNGVLVIYDVEPYLFGLLSSKTHWVWINAVSGKLKTDIRYSVNLVYNTFPFPPISTQRKQEITQSAFRILEEREKYPEKTLAQLYDPDKMPEGLREAHRLNDLAVERCYRSKPFESDEERLEY
ncbi:MAG: class I SAM-dependent DNA methyltransferase, partial [Spirochaetes bacterium]|nr:class I SAM-dependent DNA methyltransferase [Spirochaetota bacterium]